MARILGLMVVGPGEADRYLVQALEAMSDQVGEIVICLNNVDDRTREICAKYADATTEDPREWGLHQHRIKQQFLEVAQTLYRPDWILWLDADEIMQATRRELNELAEKPNEVAHNAWCLELWDSPENYNYGFLFSTPRFFRAGPTQFRGTPLHCGNVPEMQATHASNPQLSFLHYGLMRKEDRMRKFQRYAKYDPEGKYLPKDWYEALLSEHPDLRPISEFPSIMPEPIFRKKPIPKSFYG